MGCLGCTCSVSGSSNDKPMGCRSGGCASGGCNRMNTFDWLTSLDIADIESVDIVEVTFKNGSRKGFYRDDNAARVTTGDMVVVDTGTGYDVGRVSLTGELVRLQMKKKRVNEDTVITGVIRRANERDLERLQEARELEKETMVHARAIARMLGLDMKIGDVEFQGDKRKATFFYTADGRVDFRELIRHYAKEFKVKIEMRQIGARQESARIGGIGSCGRELCCSTWLTDFRSVSTAAARYQNLAINQAKLSGQCGRLKCCLNYELDTYLDALDNFPRGGEKLFTQVGAAILVKTDIFKGLMFYILENEKTRGKMYALELANVKEIMEMNSRGEKPADLGAVTVVVSTDNEDGPLDFEDVTGAIELPPDEKRRKKKKKKNRNTGGGGGGPRPPAQGQGGPRPGGPPQGNQPPRRPDNRPENRQDNRADQRPDNRPPRNDDRPPRNDDRRNKRNWKRKG
ncbi:MAG: hypothetical protein HUU34_14650 [Saprospiraceae bacterium]|nr:hypothetical protein [Saprospiraceae bacterium]